MSKASEVLRQAISDGYLTYSGSYASSIPLRTAWWEYCQHYQWPFIILSKYRGRGDVELDGFSTRHGLSKALWVQVGNLITEAIRQAYACDTRKKKVYEWVPEGKSGYYYARSLPIFVAEDLAQQLAVLTRENEGYIAKDTRAYTERYLDSFAPVTKFPKPENERNRES